jgi:hypothetical protein
VEFDKQKFKHLVHYIIWKVGKDDWFGATKLNKVLWFVDARAYVLTGKPITGETYTRGEFGPVPQHIMSIRRELEREAAIKVTQEGELTRLTPTRPAEPNWFSEGELKSIDWWGYSHLSESYCRFDQRRNARLRMANCQNGGSFALVCLSRRANSGADCRRH